MADQPTTQACVNCRYHQPAAIGYDKDGNINFLDRRPVCKRYPPREGRRDNWPYGYVVTEAYQWCGEWVMNEPETAEQAAVTLARYVLLGDMTAARALADKLRE